MGSPKAEKTYRLSSDQEARLLYGRHDEHLNLIEHEFGVHIVARGPVLTVSGDEDAVHRANALFEELLGLLRQGVQLRTQDLVAALRTVQSQSGVTLKDIYSVRIEVASKKQYITPKTPGQKAYVEAIRDYDIVFGIGPAGTGKCVAGSTLVFTDRGMIPIEHLGDRSLPEIYTPIQLQVSGLNGFEQASHVYHGGRSSTKRIVTRLGFEIEVTPEHPLYQLDEDGRPRWTPAQELLAGDYVAIQRGQRLFGCELSIEFQYRPNGPRDHARSITVTRLDEDLAYFLGILTGDGCLTSKNRVILSSTDPEILAHFYRMADRLGLHVFNNSGERPYDRIIASSQLYQLLLHLGMFDGPASTKRVPDTILRAPEACVVAFLQGLFDTDGTVHKRDGYPQLHSVSKRLIDEIQLLLLNFGILANKRKKWVWYRDQRRLSYQLELAGAEADRFRETIGFRLPRKQRLLRQGERNTNVDVIPHIQQVIRSGVSGGIFSRATHHTLDDYKRGRRRPSYGTLGEIVGLLEQDAPDTAACDLLSELYHQRFFWARIEKIEDGEAQVYDLTVPGSHSFCANGFINHNTYLSVAMAVSALKQQKVSRIILIRPAVEAGERLGFLPGDYEAKVMPYLRPLYDALYDMMEADKIRKYFEMGIIEIAPLAYMRGRTLNDAFIILDEAQNTTTEQMKMFLTRLGFDSKAVITGDITQIDLPPGRASGLVQVQSILKNCPGIKFAYFSGQDVVRHELVQEIIKAYEAHSSPGANESLG